MKKITSLFLLTSFIIWGQNGVNPSPTEIKKAQELREIYDKSDVAILKSSEKVTFSTSRNHEKVEVNHSVSERLLNINSRADIHKYEFYDSESEISTFSIKFKNNKKAAFFATDEFYKSNDLFYNDARVKYYKLDFPVQGYTYLYDMEKKTNDIKYFTTLYFNDEYPVIDKEVVITVPKWLNLEIKEFNFEGYDITKTVNSTAEGTIYKYAIKNLKPGAKEENKPGPSYLYPHLLFLAKSFTYGKETTTLFNETGDLYKWYKSLTDSMKDDPSVYAEKVKELTKDAKTDEEKVKNIYYWVQDNIRYIAFEDGIAGFKPDESNNVFTKRYGDCKGMANLIKQMLKQAGFDARLCWIGTNHIAYSYDLPSLSVDNHMICAWFKDGKHYFLDGTEKYNSLGEYANRIQGKQVLIEDGDHYILDRIPTQPSTFNKETKVITYTIADENLVGHVHQELAGESKASFLYAYNHIKNDKKEDALNWYLSGGDKNNAITNIKTSDLSNRDIKLIIDYDSTLKNQVSSFDNEIYIDFDYSKEYKGYDFEKREEDFVFSFKPYDDITTIFNIPAGYKVTKLPENKSFKSDDYTISMTFETKGNQIIYHKIFDFNSGKIRKSDFENWNKNFKEFSNLYSEQIVLSK